MAAPPSQQERSTNSMIQQKKKSLPHLRMRTTPCSQKKKNTAFLSPLHIPAQHASSHGLRDGFIHRAGKEKQKLASLRVRHPESMNPARFLGVPHSPQIGSLPQREAFSGPPEHLRSAHAAAEPRPKTGERCTAPLSWSCTQGSPSSTSGSVEKHLFPHKRNI